MGLPQQTQDSTRAGFTSVLIPYSKGLGESSFKYIWQINLKEYKPKEKEIQDFTDILGQNSSIYKGYIINQINKNPHSYIYDETGTKIICSNDWLVWQNWSICLLSITLKASSSWFPKTKLWVTKAKTLTRQLVTSEKDSITTIF